MCPPSPKSYIIIARADTLDETLGIIDVEITDADKKRVVDMNGLAVAVIGTTFLNGLEPSPDRPSTISGGSGVRYRTSHVDVNLTVPELERLVRRSLLNGEYLALIEARGEFFEIHGDFYDGDGTALQPWE